MKETSLTEMIYAENKTAGFILVLPNDCEIDEAAEKISAIAENYPGTVWEDLVQKKESYRYTFCRIKDSLGNIAFKFFGKFKLTSGIKHDEDGNRYLIWEKVSDEIHKFN